MKKQLYTTLLNEILEQQASVSTPETKEGSLEGKLNEIEQTLKELHGKIAESQLLIYKNELDELKPKIENNLNKIEGGDKRKGLFKSREKYTQELHIKLHALETKVYATAKQFGIMTPAEKKAYLTNAIKGTNQTVYIGPDGKIYQQQPAGIKCTPTSINVEQITQEVKEDPLKALTKHGFIPSGSAFLAKNTYIKPETAQVFLTVLALWAAWKTVGAIYDSGLGNKSMLRTAFIAAFGGAMFWPAIKAMAVGGYDKLPKKGMFGLEDLANTISNDSATTSTSIDSIGKKFETGSAYGTHVFSFFKDTKTLKEFMSSDGTIDMKKLNLAIQHDIDANGGARFMTDPNDPMNTTGANTAYFALSMIAAKGVNDPSINQDLQKVFSALKEKGIFDINEELNKDTPLDEIKSKFAVANKTLTTQLKKDAEDKIKMDNQKKLDALGITTGPATLDLTACNQAEVATVLGSYTNDQLINDTIKRKECISKLAQLPKAVSSFQEDRQVPLDEVSNEMINAGVGYNGFKNHPEEVSSFKEQFKSTREAIYKKEGELIHIDFDSTDKKMYIESHGRRTSIIVNTANDIHIDGTNSSLSFGSYSEAIHMADMINIIVANCMGQGEIGDRTVFQPGNSNQLIFNRADGNTLGGKLVELTLGLTSFKTNIPGVGAKLTHIPGLTGKISLLASYLNGPAFQLKDFKHTIGGKEKVESVGLSWRNGSPTDKKWIARKNTLGEKVEPSDIGSSVSEVTDQSMITSATESIKAFFGSQPDNISERDKIAQYDPKNHGQSIDNLMDNLIRYKRYSSYFNMLFLLTKGKNSLTFNKAKEELNNMKLFPGIEEDFKIGGYLDIELAKKGYKLWDTSQGNFAPGTKSIMNLDRRTMAYFQTHQQSYQPSRWTESKYDAQVFLKDTKDAIKAIPGQVKDGIKDILKGGSEALVGGLDGIVNAVNNSQHGTAIRTTIAAVTGLKIFSIFKG